MAPTDPRATPPSAADADRDAAADDGPRWLDLGSFIRDQRRLTHLSLRKLAELADVSNPYLSQIERGLRKPSAEILQQIARALSISAETLYVRAGFLDDVDGEVDVVGEIRRDHHLSAEQRQTLIRIYRSFRAEAGVPLVPGDGGEGSAAESGTDDAVQPADRDGTESSGGASR